MRPIYTQNGYKLDEVISALQKDIRRGNEEAAMFWALELVPKFEAYLWRRLSVIVNEDIGIANPLLLVLIPQQGDLFLSFRADGKDGTARLILANAILLMCRSPKSRLADHFQCVINQGRLQDGLKLPMPDYAIDKHTNAGRAAKRDVAHWLDVGCDLNPPAEPDPYADRARAYWESPHFVKTQWGKRTAPNPKKGQPAPTEDDLPPVPPPQLFDME